MSKTLVLIAEHPERGRLYAVVDPASRFVEGRVCERKFAAFLAPFPDELSARQALKAAGTNLAGNGGVV